jgi:NDP-sugar pyrophosphorylase family protein
MSSTLPPIVLQAGGKGERMRPSGIPIPKVLVPVKGVPMLERLIRQLADEGALQFYIITGYLADQVEEHVLNMRDLPPEVRISFIRETEPRGNAGSLSELADLDTPVIFSFGDLFTKLSFRELYTIHLQRGCAITAGSHFEKHRLQLGHLIVSDDSVIDYREKPEYQFLICSGIMAIQPEVLRLLPRTGLVGMNRLVLLSLEAGLKVTHWTHGAFWMDINTPDLLAAANEAAWEEKLIAAGF